MERRKHPRIQIPLEIELSHPFIGHRTVVARDLTDEGVYAWYPDAPFKQGSSMDVSLKGAPMIESRPTPTVKMRVSRIDENGLVLSFINKSGAHLWRSADLRPTELTIGKDLFRVFQAAVVQDAAGRVLTVQQSGRWLFPGNYLQAGEDWCAMLQDYLAQNLNLTDTQYGRTVLTHCDSEVVARESSTMSVFHLYRLPAPPSAKQSTDSGSQQVVPGKTAARLDADAPYSKARWIENSRQLDELSFSAEPLRELARSLLDFDDKGNRKIPAPQSAARSSTDEAARTPDRPDTKEVLRKHG